MGEPTMEEYMTRIREGYGSGIARPKIEDKDHFELKGQFLKEQRDNTFSGSDNEDVNEHIEKVLEIVDLAWKFLGSSLDDLGGRFNPVINVLSAPLLSKPGVY
ncbi:hypothetical protein Tco_0158897 [Tanacetum coccineum]